jgi:hypothetical protein
MPRSRPPAHAGPEFQFVPSIAAGLRNFQDAAIRPDPYGHDGTTLEFAAKGHGLHHLFRAGDMSIPDRRWPNMKDCKPGKSV